MQQTVKKQIMPKAWSLLLALLIVPALLMQAHADVINLGVVSFDAESNLLGSGLTADLLKRGIVDSVFSVKSVDSLSSSELWPSEDGKRAYRMNLVDSMIVVADSSAWSFRLRGGIRFHNGQYLSAKDVESSLQRCINQGLFNDFAQVSSELRREVDTIANSVTFKAPEQWFTIKLKLENIAKVASDTAFFALLQKRLADGLANCPITEKTSSAIFSEHLGYGTNLISLGEYALIRFQAGREYVLERVFQERSSREGAQTIVLRNFNEGAHALTALRLGTVDAIFIDSDAAEVSKAASDETLKVAKCMTGSVIHRNGLKIPCEAASFRLVQVRYTG